MISTHGLFLGTDTKTGERLYLPASARQNSIEVVGQPGQGKSKFLEHLLRQDIKNGEGLCLIDPHGSVFAPLVKWCAAHRYFDLRRIVVLDVARDGWSFGFNPLGNHDGTPDSLLEVVDAMANATSQAWGGEDLDNKPTISYVLPAIYQLLGERGLTLSETPFVIEQGPVLDDLIGEIQDENLKRKWLDLANKHPRDWNAEVVGPRNRISRFIEDSRVRCILGQTEPVIDLQALMDEKAIVLVNLAGIQPQRRRLLGSLLVSAIYSAALRRKADRGPAFHVYIDEAHLFINQDVERLLTEGRKFGVWLVLAHQDLAQLRREAGEAVFSAVMLTGTKVVFGGLPFEDAEYLARELWSGFTDYERPKEAFIRPTVVGQKIITLSGWQSSSSSSTGRSTGSSTGTGHSQTYGQTGTFGAPDLSSSTTGQQQVSTNLETSGHASSDGSSEHETAVPIFEDLPTVAYSLEEMRDFQAGILKRQRTQHAVVQVMHGCPYHLKVPFVDEPRITEKYVQKRLEQAVRETPFALPRAVAQRHLEDRRIALQSAASTRLQQEEPETFSERSTEDLFAEDDEKDPTE